MKESWSLLWTVPPASNGKKDIFVSTYREGVQKAQAHQSGIGRSTADGCDGSREDNAGSQVVLQMGETSDKVWWSPPLLK